MSHSILSPQFIKNFLTNLLSSPGDIIMTGKTTARSGWLLCNGQAVSRETYANLFEEIGTTYGTGDGSTTFNVPDMRQRFVLGRSDSGTGQFMGETGGTIDHSHTTPDHSHAVDDHTHLVGAHYHSKGDLTVGSEGSHTHSIAHNHAAFTATSGQGNSMFYRTVGSSTTGTNTAANHQAVYVAGASFTDRTDTNYMLQDHTHTTTIDIPNYTGNSGAGSNHTHSLTGDIGATGSGNNGDSGFTSGGVTGSSLSTDSSGGSNTGTNNPPYIVVNYMIKT